ncbi:MAG: hypothetical protein Q9M08_05145 [Mariprofundus sp.]|nr:hypothetical protein [Mariprofundus sp.]
MNHPAKNSVTASLQFDFRGQSFKPSITVDLDSLMQRQGDLNGLHDMLAASIGLDSYRHEYDVMLLHEITFSEPSGLAMDFTLDGRLNFDGFIEAWQKQKMLRSIEPIARKHLDIVDLDQHPDICNALLESYRLGQIAHSRNNFRQ